MHIHFIGICGIGMSGIAKILLEQGFNISGCDQNIDSTRSKELINLGCKIDIHLSSTCNDSSISMIVRSSDITLEHPEILQALKNNIPIKLRAEVLAEIMKQHSNPIAVAGAHGKTTTSSLLSHIFVTANKNPTIVVGGHIHQLNSNAKYGNSNYLIAEADESDRSFLLLPKKYSIVTNIDREHLGTYKDIEDIKSSFTTFINTIPKDGLTVICYDNLENRNIFKNIQASYITYGVDKQADFHISNITLDAYESYFYVYNNKTKEDLGLFQVNLPGHHNVLNATSAIVISLLSDIPLESIKLALRSFQGVDRRFTFKGKSKVSQALIFDDYGHHPTEIEATLKVARNASQGKVIIAFQPQRFSRTKNLWDEFIQVFAHAPIDELILTDIYPANEAPIEGITSKNLMLEIKKINPNLSIQYISSREPDEILIQLIESNLSKNDLLLFLGAGKINKLSEKMIA